MTCYANLMERIMKFKAWLIKALGGITLDDHEKARARYESWAVENLTGKLGEITPDCAYYFPFEDADILVIRSRICISNAKIKSLKVAPWCKQVVCHRLRV